MSILALMVLGIGFFPDTVSGYLQAAADSLFDKTQYIHSVLTTTIQ
jgi:formate hydrogenlyase subunit 3/multisubunit Na+/H+ antiporter MnhD subunit